MPGEGVAPSHPEGYRILSPVRLLIPPPRQITQGLLDFDQKDPDARSARGDCGGVRQHISGGRRTRKPRAATTQMGLFHRNRGANRSRTGVRGFADRCLTARPSRQSFDALAFGSLA